MSTLYVSVTRGVLDSRGSPVPPGQAVDPSRFNPGRLDSLVKAGYLAPEAPPEPQKPQGRDRVSPAKWTARPEDLEGLTLDELNVRILEIDDSIEPFDTIQEATYWLTQECSEGGED